MPIWAFLLSGIASWFTPDSMYGSAHVCAANAIPISTHVEIVNVDNHHSTDCVIVGTGPFAPGRVLDVSPSVRDVLGMEDAGLANVRIYRIIGQLPSCKLAPQAQTCKSAPPHLCVLDLPKPVLLDCH